MEELTLEEVIVPEEEDERLLKLEFPPLFVAALVTSFNRELPDRPVITINLRGQFFGWVFL